MRIIVNADDLGLSPEVNERIFDLMAQRRLTSATILANAPHWAEAVRRIPQFPYCSFGVHLNLTQFRPLTDAAALRPFLDESGQFSLPLFRATRLTAALRRAVYQEWSAQINRLQAAGLRISHLDSHHDVHVRLPLFWTLKRLQRTLGIRKVRLAENLLAAGQPPPRRTVLWNLAVRLVPPSRTTDGFGQFAALFQAPPHRLASWRSLELMAHPAHPHFAAETALLETSWWTGLPFPVQLISYLEL